MPEHETMTCATCGRKDLAVRKIDLGGTLPGRAPARHYRLARPSGEPDKRGNDWCPGGEKQGISRRPGSRGVRRYG